jgi:hypothetical protein
VDLQRAGRFSRNTLVSAASVALFLFALMSVFVGFVGYVSRVNLTAEFQKDGEQDIDHIFMTIDQLKRDERELSRLRQDLRDQIQVYLRKISDLDAEADVSPEYRKYFSFVLDLWALLERHGALLQPEYIKRARGIDYVRPSLDQSHLFGNPEFKLEKADSATVTVIGSAKGGQEELLQQLGERLQGFRTAVVEYIATFHYRRKLLEFQRDELVTRLRRQIEAIVERRPHLAIGTERADLKLPETDADKMLQIEKQRAILRSYEKAMYGLEWFLEWPIIVSTMFVTLAMGLLGGVVSFMRTAIDDPDQFLLAELLRRSLLGIAASLGIFLLAGSGLLVLTAQSSKAFTPSTIELSPYFVAFLAFISGFLADDAFARLTKAGRSLFNPDADAPPPPGPDGAPPAAAQQA